MVTIDADQIKCMIKRRYIDCTVRDREGNDFKATVEHINFNHGTISDDPRVASLSASISNNKFLAFFEKGTTCNVSKYSISCKKGE